MAIWDGENPCARMWEWSAYRAGMGIKSRTEYVVAFTCGHHTWTTHETTAGIAWCWTCQQYVGLIVQRIEEVPPSTP